MRVSSPCQYFVHVWLLILVRHYEAFDVVYNFLKVNAGECVGSLQLGVKHFALDISCQHFVLRKWFLLTMTAIIVILAALTSVSCARVYTYVIYIGTRKLGRTERSGRLMALRVKV
ncbi:hypothetical protein ACH5RR_035405 [Cinchona calisaya]|uniref:Uncharacterized protein n=1 Tax=Cinchona calisaya TaxID=153742 RepID=A0ABD2Y1Q0_9GENT